jgi:hypothetical protein
MVVQVRIPNIDTDDSQVQFTQVSPTSDTNGNISVTPRIKRRQQSAQNDESTDRYATEDNSVSVRKAMETTGMRTAFNASETTQRAARERSAARRAALSPAEAEEQRMLTRQRNAVRRANLADEEVDQQRTLARERSAARRATLSTADIDQQRIRARERSAVKRATLSPAETEQQRILERDRSAARRATISPAETEQQRTLARERSAARRATLSPAETEQQRILARERSAARKVDVSEKEIQKQRVSAAERMMTGRAAASPIVAEEQRMQARNRSAAKRAAYSKAEAEEQRALVRQKYSLQETSKRTHLKHKQEQGQGTEVEWPRLVEMERKTSCLKNFIQQMSMSSLAQGVCGICNIRCWKKNLRCVPLEQVPSLDLLETHEDLRNIINGTKRPRSVDLKNNDNVDSSGVPKQAG